MGEWDRWRKEATASHPVRYWIAEEALDWVQDTITWPFRMVDAVRYYIMNRWVTKSHALTAHPSVIKPGYWRDVGDRFLPCLFNELVDFVEVESAWHHVVWDKEAKKKYNVPVWRRSWPYYRKWRSAEAGVDHLNWAASLTNEDYIGEDEVPEPTGQALAAKEILEIYTWYKEVYLKRPDPMDESGWSDYCDNRRDGGLSILDEDRTEEETTLAREIHDRLTEIETRYEEEDTEMLVRLIKVRRDLWT